MNTVNQTAAPEGGRLSPILSPLLPLVLSLLAASCDRPPTITLPRPSIESHCSVNGFGRGTCRFVNWGDGVGATRLKVSMVRTSGRESRSATVYSGLVQGKDVVERSVSIPGVEDLCSPSRWEHQAGKDWSDLCDVELDELPLRRP